jgi:hypothetical protein
LKSSEIIRTKLHRPFTRRELVTRTRLQEKVLDGLGGPLTLITAPAGFGTLTIIIPAGVNAVATLDGGLSSVDASGEWVQSGDRLHATGRQPNHRNQHHDGRRDIELEDRVAELSSLCSVNVLPRRRAISLFASGDCSSDIADDYARFEIPFPKILAFQDHCKY